MDRDIPSFNRAVMERIYAKNHQLHLKRLKNIKSGISSHKSYKKSKPSYLPHSNSIVDTNYQIKLPQYNNVKKQVIQQSKNAQIQRQNALLFQKMMKIMKRPDKNNDPASNRQRQSMNVAKQRISMQYTKINEENRAFYHRLEHQKPTIDNKKLEEQRMKNLNILKFLGKYPNHQARARASQYKTFDLRSRRMNSTSNRVYYNNQGLNNYEQNLDENGEQSLIKFRNQMVEYDRHMQRLKIQQQKGQNKVNSTMGTFYNNRKKQSLLRQNGKYTHVNSNQLSEIQIYEPVIPSRRKFISQGESRKESYQQRLGMKQRNFYDKNEITNNIDNKGVDQQQELYPYHLNHPSHNIVIQDHNLYNLNRKKKESIEISKMPDQSDTNRTTFSKPTVPQQRKLNSKNSQKSLLSSERNINSKQKESENNEYKTFMRGNDNTESEPIPRFAKNNNSKNNNDNNKSKTSIISNNKNNNINNITNPVNVKNNMHNKKQQQNVILLYKNIVQLNSLLLEQQKQQLLRDIQQDLDKENDEKSNNNPIQIQSRLFDEILAKYFNCQISIYRMFDSYKISVEIDDGNRFITNKKRTKLQQDNNNNENNNMLSETSKQLVEWIRKSIMGRLEHVCEVWIPQRQGSLLLQEIDYDYKQFIVKMLKIQKDINNLNVTSKKDDNKQEQEQQQSRYLQQQQSNDGYRLVIVLNTNTNQEEIVLNTNQQDNKCSDKEQVCRQMLSINNNSNLQSQLIKTSNSVQRNSQTLINTNNTIKNQLQHTQTQNQNQIQINEFNKNINTENEQNNRDHKKQIDNLDLFNKQQNVQNNGQVDRQQKGNNYDSVKKLNNQQHKQENQYLRKDNKSNYPQKSNNQNKHKNQQEKQKNQQDQQDQDQQQQEQNQQNQKQSEQKQQNKKQQNQLQQKNQQPVQFQQKGINQVYIQALDQQLL